MPALAHEALVELFRNRPVLAVELLRVTGQVHLDGGAARVGSIDLSQAAPPELRCDVLIEVYEQARPTAVSGGSPDAAVIVEVQRSKDDSKRRSWPVYVAVAVERLRCPVYLLVIATTREVGRWAARAIVLGHPGFRLSPIVLDFDHMPRVTEREVARRAPELAVLSALAHQGEEGRRDERLTVVRELLVAKFGPLSPAIATRLAASSYDELGELAKRLLAADSLDALFAGT